MKTILQKLTRALQSEPDVAFAYLFGSTVARRNGPLSDIDVAIYFHPSGTVRSRFKRRLQLMSILSEALQWDDVDLVPLQDAPLDLARDIVANGKLAFCRNNKLRVDFVFRVVRDYLDAEPVRKLEWEALTKHFENVNYGRPNRRPSLTPKKASRNVGRIGSNSSRRPQGL